MAEFESIPVLDKGFVRLIDVMGDDQRIAAAARVSYGGGAKSKREDAALIDYLMRNRHTSPFEMVEFTFHVKAPIFVARQWFRHRTASVNEISARYSVLDDDFFQPAAEELRGQGAANKQVGEGNLPSSEAAELANLIKRSNESSYAAYEKLLEGGLAREQARSVLPVGIYTQFYWKQDLHNLLHFLKLRLDWHAQAEIRAYAEAISGIVKRVVPASWRAFEEHALHSASFSRAELQAISRLVSRETLETELRESGLSRSRVEETLRKIYGS